MRRGFTLVELMVVVGILAILITALVSVSGTVMRGAKVRDTRTLLLNIQAAIDQFNDDAPLKRVKDYRQRYGNFPCDELEGFLPKTAPNGAIPGTGGGTYIRPGVGAALNRSASLSDIENQDIKAMALTIRLYNAEVAAILDRISPRYRRPPVKAVEFFDRDGDTAMGTDDVPLGYFVDTWGTPIQYFAVRDKTLYAAPNDNMNYRRDTSVYLVKQNRGKSVLVSYGPDGQDQWSQELRQFIDIPGIGLTDLVTDFTQTTPGVIDNPFNEDNVYVDESLNERLRPAD